MGNAFVAKFVQDIVEDVLSVVFLMTFKMPLDELLYFLFVLGHVCEEGYLR